MSVTQGIIMDEKEFIEEAKKRCVFYIETNWDGLINTSLPGTLREYSKFAIAIIPLEKE